ncbi:PEPxxWA-CTERM sorting domain-containing protein [Phenylobacterium sp.]|uniref:PEPxxWA-CTERM sorting domain-containing protein n=1 Tax=Phenylobacterium sp. TaxID=1871053 RepID=UPI002734052A|nr:PEPxxWA-CTERM sorting domain-containing protein [Phenylobacterium sp.]MDP3852663.1 PEPxxWA-CTERM sorting domain-containing protein [Phenylobacterium sp.]
MSGAGAATYSAYDQFNVAGGAITATDFAFGYLPGGDTFGGALTAFTRFDTNCAGNVNFQCAATFSGDTTPGVYKAAGSHATGTVVFQPGELNLHPGSQGELTAVQFIAPIAGLYSFSGTFSINDLYPNSVSLLTYVGGTNTHSSTLSGGFGSSYAINFDANLAAAQRVTFLVGPNGAYNNDSTGFALTVSAGGVPEPATWAMMILGFAGTGVALRRQKAIRAAA